MNNKIKQEIPLHVMLLVPVILVIIYNYGPMFGLFIAFQDYIPSNKGLLHSFLNGDWIGLDMFRYILMMPDFTLIMRNTLFIALMKIAAKIVFPLMFSLMLNEVSKKWVKKSVQTITFLPFFLSWVILGGILLEVFSPRNGIVNMVLENFGYKAFYFFGNDKIFPYMLVLTDLWKEIGFTTIILLAALTGIDPTLYEAASIDGAGRWKQTLYITFPSIMGMVILLTILGMGNIMNAGFEQIFMLYGPSVYSTGDIIDTYTYRMGIENGQFVLATAVGLFKSVISLIVMVSSYSVAKKYSNYKIF
ncbi:MULTISPECIES: sugar ABC transporter permease [unclassified Oceanispirochaeta]|uniref:ABC transporter permease n=1 Tax=unclassified Oceanispirochaeta TaxID=2635722 RepID=UPI000E095995|nr:MULTISPECIES: ABC transporter permease subunit [unclassified Oceanispirochaeta]MBF9018917.1 sugar ABC transporter permease [Oceanispirochaeta sp. M2]NPD75416.1 sugar ABC transporter permease [Oceanispirochaeta sp. M1]RDG28728.1 sugar ABC transporter permease [Oceanispirochaeta sp. M1]